METKKEGLYKYLVIFAYFFLLVYMSFVLFINQTYDPDNTAALWEGYGYNVNWPDMMINSLLGGRPIGVLLMAITIPLDRLGINYLNNVFVLQLMLMFFLSAGLTVLYATFSDEFEKISQKWIWIIIALGLISPFYVEYFAFGGPTGGVGALLAAMGLLFFYRGKYKISFLFCFLSVGTYQINYQIFLIYGLALLFICETSWNKKTLVQGIRLFIIAGGSAMIVLLCPKFYSLITQSNEVKETIIGQTDKHSLGLNIFYAYREYLNILKHNYGLLPMYFLVVLIIMFQLVCICILIKNDRHRIISYIVTSIIIWMIPASFSIVMATIYLPSRTLIGIFVAFSAQLLMTYKVIEKYYNNFRIIAAIVQGMIAIYFLVNFYSIQTTAADVLVTNKMEMAQMRMMQDIIEEYEQESGNSVDTVVVTHLKTGIYAYDKVNTYMNYMGYPSTHMVINKEWCDVEFLNYVNSENYKRQDMSEEDANRLFSDLKWEDFDTFNPKNQMVFENNILYWAQY